MKFLAFLIPLMFLQSNWITFTSKAPAFSIEFPGKIEKKFKIIKTDIGEIEINTLYHSSSIDSTSNELYLLNYYKLDTAIFKGDSAITKEEYINNIIDNIASSLQGTILYSNIDNNNNTTTAIYRIEYNKGQSSMKGKIVLNGEYLYSLEVFTSKQYSLNKNIERFIKSFYISPD